FWFFGHPEVYIIFLPAAGMVSMIVPAMAGTPLAGHRLVVLALVAVGFLSFGLWVHHMFATGIPQLSLSFFQAASMAVAIPSGIQVFAWIATFARGKVKLTTPTLFILGFLFIFVLGGLTGVMVAVVPFDLQVHDTYFVVAHFHYVLVGGMVFPLFAAFYYWVPYTSRHALSERVGRWVFGLVFAGFNVAFFPMHITGLIGMPRRVYSYQAGLGWEGLNMVSTAGAFLIAVGVLVLLVDLARRFRMSAEGNAGNVWSAGTLEWLPSGNYSNRSVPRVESLYPLWDQPGLAEQVKEGAHYLPNAPTGGRDTIITSAVEARPQFVLRLPMPGWAPLVAAWFTAAFFILLTFKLVAIAAVCGVIAIGAMLHWGWRLDPAHGDAADGEVDVGGGLRLPTYVTGPVSQSWWAVVVLMLVAGSLYACLLFSYLYYWTVSPQHWRPAPDAGFAAAVAALLVAGSAAVGLANRMLKKSGRCWPLAFAVPLLAAAYAVHLSAFASLTASESIYGAIVHAFFVLDGFFATAAILLALFTLAKRRAGLIGSRRRVTFDNCRLFWHYTVAQTLAGLAMLYGFPALVLP
ncbi:MAG TPA: cbb3-type cytochrome c oxidase subunit I, partial [Burkholderiales bacterium]|nr:cbb3-type cytochrome c oxidase subunit I [Burkholderiales bacterium]